MYVATTLTHKVECTSRHAASWRPAAWLYTADQHAESKINCSGSFWNTLPSPLWPQTKILGCVFCAIWSPKAWVCALCDPRSDTYTSHSAADDLRW